MAAEPSRVLGKFYPSIILKNKTVAIEDYTILRTPSDPHGT